jgi:hypothetical protein
LQGLDGGEKISAVNTHNCEVERRMEEEMRDQRKRDLPRRGREDLWRLGEEETMSYRLVALI